MPPPNGVRRDWPNWVNPELLQIWLDNIDEEDFVNAVLENIDNENENIAQPEQEPTGHNNVVRYEDPQYWIGLIFAWFRALTRRDGENRIGMQVSLLTIGVIILSVFIHAIVRVFSYLLS